MAVVDTPIVMTTLGLRRFGISCGGTTLTGGVAGRGLPVYLALIAFSGVVPLSNYDRLGRSGDFDFASAAGELRFAGSDMCDRAHGAGFRVYQGQMAEGSSDAALRDSSDAIQRYRWHETGRNS